MTLAELIIAVMTLAIGVAGVHQLLVASDQAADRVFSRAAASSLARRAAADAALMGYAEALARAQYLEAGAPALLSADVRQPPGSRVDFAVALQVERRPGAAVLLRAFAWRLPGGQESKPDAAALAASPIPPSDALWESAEITLFPPSDRLATVAMIEQANQQPAPGETPQAESPEQAEEERTEAGP